MPSNMPLPGNGGASIGKRKRASATSQKWTLLNLRTTWFLSDDEPLRVDPTAGDGASHDQWRELVKRTRVRIPSEQLAQPWGQMARRDFLNWCESNLPEERWPALFSSREDALNAREISILFEEGVSDSKRIEISKSRKSAPEDEPPDSIA